MPIHVREEGPSALAEYARISASFEVRERLVPTWVDGGLGGIRLDSEVVSTPRVKNYDAVGDTPSRWAEKWDVSRWGILLARDGDEAVGGAAVACGVAGPFVLTGREDLATLVDLRVRPERRREGLGRKLFEGAAAWARERGSRGMRIETQDNNVAACRLYAACGCRLCGVFPRMYPELPEEVCLLWHLTLD